MQWQTTDSTDFTDPAHIKPLSALQGATRRVGARLGFKVGVPRLHLRTASELAPTLITPANQQVVGASADDAKVIGAPLGDLSSRLGVGGAPCI